MTSPIHGRRGDRALRSSTGVGRGGWPLPTAGGRWRGTPQSDHTCLLQSLQKTKKNRRCGSFSLPSFASSFCRKRLATAAASLPAPVEALFDLGFCAGFFQLLPDLFGILLGNAFLDRLGRAVNQVLGFLQAQPGNRAHHLDDVHLVVTGRGENYGKLGLFLRSGSRAATTRGHRYGNRRRGGGNPEFFFHVPDELRELEDAHIADGVEKFSFCHCHFVSPEILKTVESLMLRGLFLIPDRSQRAHKLSRHFVECPDKFGD